MSVCAYDYNVYYITKMNIVIPTNVDYWSAGSN